MIDLHCLQRGKKFSDLPESYVIFITKTDILGMGRTMYAINRYIFKNSRKGGKKDKRVIQEVFQGHIRATEAKAERESLLTFSGGFRLSQRKIKYCVLCVFTCIILAITTYPYTTRLFKICESSAKYAICIPGTSGTAYISSGMYIH